MRQLYRRIFIPIARAQNEVDATPSIPGDVLTTEAGDNLTTEAGDDLTLE